ncbi:MAG: phosphoribosylaminoimidazolesuccinocarboxamide synthase [Planctomycetota bacterium]
MTTALATTDLDGLRCVSRGKVRDIYEVGNDLLLVATDRVSAYDAILDPPIPDKGCVLTQISLFWFATLKDVVPHHVLEADVEKRPSAVAKHADVLRGRALLVRKLSMLPVECVARGYLVGSGWKDYKASGAVCGHALPAGLAQAARLDPPLFTPATKAETGHDENIDIERAGQIIGRERARELEAKTLELYARAREIAAERGVIIADTKLEFGVDQDGQLVLGDEAFTPDSSRFWDIAEWREGQSPKSFDKQLVRDWLDASGWDHEPPAPRLAPEIVAQTTATYREIFTRITGRDLDDAVADPTF